MFGLGITDLICNILKYNVLFLSRCPQGMGSSCFVGGLMSTSCLFFYDHFFSIFNHFLIFIV